jgi:hypothetical protein
MLSPQSRDNDKIANMATMDTTRLSSKGLGRKSSATHGSHGYHERSRDELGLHVDSMEALFESTLRLRIAQKYMKLENLSMVARDGIEPPTPAFSAPSSESAKWSGISGCH